MSLLFAPRCRRAPSEKAVSRLCCRLYLLFSHILGVSLPPSACSNPLCRHPPPSSEGGEGTPVPCTELTHCGKEDRAKETHQGCVLVQVAFALQRRGEGAPAPCTEFALCGGRERRFALNMPRSAEKARSFAEKFFILRGFGRRRLDYYGEQRYN